MKQKALDIGFCYASLLFKYMGIAYYTSVEKRRPISCIDSKFYLNVICELTVMVTERRGEDRTFFFS